MGFYVWLFVAILFWANLSFVLPVNKLFFSEYAPGFWLSLESLMTMPSVRNCSVGNNNNLVMALNHSE